MDALQEARTVIRDAEQRLQALMDRAIQKGGYTDVVQLAEMAQTLSRLAETPDERASAATPRPAYAPTQPRSRRAKRAAISEITKKATYPKFEVNDNRLVKIGWSKKEKSEYEHKAPREIALCVYLQLGEISSAGPFRMEEQFPIRLSDGTEVPSYQSYLVLAWLRHIGHVEKLGKDSYQWLAGDGDESSFEEAWDLMVRRASKSRGLQND